MATVRRVAPKPKKFKKTKIGKNGTKGTKKSTKTKTLPKDKNVPPNNLGDYCIIVYGEKGIGKTSLASEFPKSITFQLEPRRRNLKIRQQEIKSSNRDHFESTGECAWLELKEYLLLTVSDGSVGTIVIDTVDRAYLACFNHCCWKAGVNHPNDIKNDYGKMWGTIKQEFEETFQNVLYSNEVGLLFVSHAQTREVESALGSFEIQSPTCQPACWLIMKALVDYAFYYGFYEAKRSLVVRGNDFIWASSGVADKFLDKKTKKPAAIISAGLSSKEAYENLTKSFDNKLTALQLEEDIVERHEVED